MRIYILPLILLFVLGALLLAFGLQGLRGENAVSSDNSYEEYNALVRSSTALYPRPAPDEEQYFTIDDVRQLVQKQRSSNMNAWQEFLETTQEAELLANAFSYLALTHYTNARDFVSIGSAKEAISMFTSAIILAPGSTESGYREIEWERRRFLESSYTLLARAIEKEQKRQSQQQNKQVSLSDVPATESVGEEGPDSGDEIPTLIPGESP